MRSRRAGPPTPAGRHAGGAKIHKETFPAPAPLWRSVPLPYCASAGATRALGGGEPRDGLVLAALVQAEDAVELRLRLVRVRVGVSVRVSVRVRVRVRSDLTCNQPRLSPNSSRLPTYQVGPSAPCANQSMWLVSLSFRKAGRPFLIVPVLPHRTVQG